MKRVEKNWRRDRTSWIWSILSGVLAIFVSVVTLPQAAIGQAFVDSLTADSSVTATQIRTLLQSSAAREQAWGAWLAGRAMTPEWPPLLERIVNQNLSEQRDQGRANVLDTALDALLQSDVRMSPDWILTIYPRRPAQALILLARLGSDADGALLGIAERETQFSWYAAGNLLLNHRAPGFVALLLQRVEISVDIVVVDPGKEFFRGIAGSQSGGSSTPGISIPGFPPLPLYWLTGDATSTKLLGAGPNPVYYGREVMTAGRMPGHRIPGGPRTDDFLRYIQAAAPSKANMQSSYIRSTEWRGRTAFGADVESIRQTILDQYSKLIQELTAAGVITSDERVRVTAPKLSISLSDQRSDKSSPLELPR